MSLLTKRRNAVRKVTKKEILLLICTVLLGAGLGVLSKCGDVAVTGGFFGNLLFSFGQISSGFFIWIVLCLLIAVSSDTRLTAALNVGVFLLSMLTGYYLYSYYAVHYLVKKIVVFWTAAILPASLAGFVVHNIGESKRLKIAVTVTGLAALLYDIAAKNLFEPTDMIITAVLLVFFLLILRKSRDKNNTRCS